MIYNTKLSGAHTIYTLGHSHLLSSVNKVCVSEHIAPVIIELETQDTVLIERIMLSIVSLDQTSAVPQVIMLFLFDSNHQPIVVGVNQIISWKILIRTSSYNCTDQIDANRILFHSVHFTIDRQKFLDYLRLPGNLHPSWHICQITIYSREYGQKFRIQFQGFDRIHVVAISICAIP